MKEKDVKVQGLGLKVAMADSASKASRGGRRPPKPAEVIAYYKSKGLSQEEACEKAVEALQQALAVSVRRNKLQPERVALLEAHILNVGKAVGDLDRRLDRLEYKLDSKPNFGGVFAAGMAAGAFLKVVLEGTPHVARAFMQVSGRGR